MEENHIYRAIEALRNEVLALDKANSQRWEYTEKTVSELKSTLDKSVTEIKTEVATVKNKTSDNAASITRLNLVVFGIGGPSALVGLTAALRVFFG